ncbi:MAG TPA: NAD(P)-dependent oxidoreductase, partial [Dehalococcoidia bacterium]|nr:NAD(P)-dependent oxidoreductase [Dehalococcoidia bacterium]
MLNQRTEMTNDALGGRANRLVLVAGGAGYVGSVLVGQLLERDYRVRVIDLGLFGTDHLPGEVDLIVGDVMDLEDRWLDGVGAVINLAGLSNDPMADFSPKLNYQYNAAAAALLAQVAKRAGVQRFVFGSTCS